MIAILCVYTTAFDRLIEEIRFDGNHMQIVDYLVRQIYSLMNVRRFPKLDRYSENISKTDVRGTCYSVSIDRKLEHCVTHQLIPSCFNISVGRITFMDRTARPKRLSER